MKYRIISVRQTKIEQRRGTIRARRRTRSALVPFCSLPEAYFFLEEIDIDALFALGELPEPRDLAKRKKARKEEKKHRLARALALAKQKIKERVAQREPRVSRLSFFAGVLCSAICVGAISALTVLLGLFGGYLAPYEELTVPSLVGQTYSDAEASVNDGYRLLVSYENSEDVAAGVIISQSPSAGVTRKLYKNGDKCALTLKVSAGRHFYLIEELSGNTERDSLLKLRNSGVSVNVSYDYSDTVPEGTVIGTVPPAGQRLYDGEVLTLTVSLGKKTPTVTVPDLYGLGEVQAEAALRSRGLKLGKITYTASNLPSGKVIAQQFSPYSPIDKGSSVDITVSIGNGFVQKTVPDLYGLTVEQAEKRLSEVGLVIGSVYSVTSGAPKGTVVSQTPIPDTPIISTITSVDIYISS